MTVSNEHNGVTDIVNIDKIQKPSAAGLQQKQQTNIQTISKHQEQKHFELKYQIGKVPDGQRQPPSAVLVSTLAVDAAATIAFG